MAVTTGPVGTAESRILQAHIGADHNDQERNARGDED
jgi:hypothetical protein